MGAIFAGIFSALLLSSTLALPSRRTRGDIALSSNNFVGDGTNELATAVLQGYVDSDTNLAFSPLGYSALLAILAEGASGETRNQLVNALHLPADIEVTRASYKNVLSRMMEKNSLNRPEFRNWFYIYRNFSVEPDYRNILQEYYLTEVKDVDRIYKDDVKTEAESMKKPESPQITDMSISSQEEPQKDSAEDSMIPANAEDPMVPEKIEETTVAERIEEDEKIPEKIESTTDSSESTEEIMQVSEEEDDKNKNGPMKIVLPIPFPEKLRLRKLNDEKEASGQVMTMQEQMLGIKKEEEDPKKDEKMEEMMNDEKKDEKVDDAMEKEKNDDKSEQMKDEEKKDDMKVDKIEEMKDEVKENEKVDKMEEMKDEVKENEKKDDKMEVMKDEMMENEKKDDKIEEIKDDKLEDEKKDEMKESDKKDEMEAMVEEGEKKEKLEKIKADLREEFISLKKKLEGDKKEDMPEKEVMNNEKIKDDKVDEVMDDKKEVMKEDMKDEIKEDIKDDKKEVMKDDMKEEMKDDKIEEMKDEMKENDKKEVMGDDKKESMEDKKESMMDVIKEEIMKEDEKDKKKEEITPGVMMEEAMKVDPMKEEALISQAMKEQTEIMMATGRKSRHLELSRLSRGALELNDVTSGLSSNNIVRKDAESEPVSQMLVFNGLYFKGTWATPFVNQREDSFYKSDNEKSTVIMMNTQGSFRAGNIPDLDSVAIELPYKGDRYSLLVLMPNSRTGLRQLISDLTGYSLRDLQKFLQVQDVEVCLPSFEIQTTSKPIKALNKLGVSDVFSKDQADLSGISKDAGLFVEELVQLVTVRVDEGSGSYNQITAGNPSTRSGLNKFVADHPFLYFVRDTVDNLIVVAGKVVDPSAASADP